MTTPRNIVIVGGVAGGMSCATRLRRLDEKANITVLEKGPYPSFANCGIPYALGGVISDEAKLHVQTVDKLHSWFNLDVRINTELLSIDRPSKTIKILSASKDEQTLPYDKLVLALGAEAFIPPIEGASSKHVFTLQSIPNLQDIQAYIAANSVKKVAIIGAGFIGIEAAENLARLGLEGTIYEFAPHVFPLVDADMAEVLHTEMRRHGIKLVLNARVQKITEPSPSEPGKVYAAGADGAEADLVIIAVGVRARTAIPATAGLKIGRTGVAVNAQMQTSDPDIYAVGDMVETPHLITHQNMQLALAGPANRQGRLVADHITGKTDVAYRGNVGTSVCKVFGQTVGLVGFSTTMMDRLGTKYEYVTVHPPHHAGYYPGAAPMTLKVSFAPDTGKLLSAQIVGPKGVDKRVDVLATAIRAGMTVEDLEHLELAYAPPYGSAKDPVNMAGFVGGNVLRGDVEIVHVADLASGKEKLCEYEVVDVRSAEEFARGHLKGAMNLPIATLRETMVQVDKGKKVLVYCWVGYRGYLAYRVFKQDRYNVRNLDGGFKTVSEGGYETLQDSK